MVNMGFVPGKSLLKKTFPARFFLSLCLPQPTLSPKILLLFFLCFPFPPQATSGLDSLNHKNRASTLSMNFSPCLQQLASPESSNLWLPQKVLQPPRKETSSAAEKCPPSLRLGSHLKSPPLCSLFPMAEKAHSLLFLNHLSLAASPESSALPTASEPPVVFLHTVFSSLFLFPLSSFYWFLKSPFESSTANPEVTRGCLRARHLAKN